MPSGERVSALTTALAILVCNCFREGAALCQNLIDGCDRDFLQQELVNRPVGAVLSAEPGSRRLMQRQTMDLAAVVVPMNAPVSSPHSPQKIICAKQ